MRTGEDYFHFITEVANGGAGPDYGLFPLGYRDDVGGKLRRWDEEDGFVGILSEPFQFMEPWNDTTGMPDYEQEDEEGYDEKMNAVAALYAYGWWLREGKPGMFGTMAARTTLGSLP